MDCKHDWVVVNSRGNDTVCCRLCQGCYPVWSMLLDIARLTRERDEALAEVESIRGIVSDIADEVSGPHPVDMTTEDMLGSIESEYHKVRILAVTSLAEVGRLCKLFDSSGEHNVPELLDHYWQWSGSAERARVVAWLRGQGAWEKDIANAIEAGEHDK